MRRVFVTGLISALVLLSFAFAVVPAAATIVPEWTAETPLGDVRSFFASAQIGDTVYFFGGYSDSWTVFDFTNSYDLQTEAWTDLAPMPTGVISGSAAVGTDGLIYVFGGYNESLGRVPYTQIYDPETDQWSTGADMFTGVSYANAAAGDDGMLYVFGGEDDIGFVLDTVQIYDPVTDSWFYGSAMPEPRYFGAVSGDGEYFYYTGGYNSGVVSTMYAYSVSGDSWYVYSAMPVVREAHSSAIGLDGNLYVFGGYTTTTASDVWMFSEYTDEWTQLPDISLARWTTAAASSSDGRMFVMGGSDGLVNFDTVESIRVASWSVTISEDSVEAGGVIALSMDYDFAYIEPYASDVMVYLVSPDGVVMNPDEYYCPVEGPFMVEIAVPESASPGVYTLVVEGFYVEYSWYWVSIASLSIPFTVLDTYTLEEQLAMLEDNVTALGEYLQSQVDALAVAVADGDAALAADIATLQAAVDSLSGELADAQDALDALSTTVDEDNEAMAADIADLQTQLAALQTSLTSLQTSIDEANDGVTDVQGSVDDKMSLVMGYAILGLLVVVIVLLAMMMVMGRKAAPPPPSS